MIATNQSLIIDRLLTKAVDGRRLSVDESLQLASDASLTDLGLAADLRRQQLNPGRRVSYIVERNINYTNVCNVYCTFCAFYRGPGRPGGYTLRKEELAVKFDELIAAGGIQVLLQGGLNPELGIEYYEDLFRWMRQQYPTVNLHALSADEVMHVSKVSNLSIEEALSRLIAAGMGSLPGAGAEILVDHVRRRIAKFKSGADKWIDVHRTAHRLGIPSTCTMMFGVQETWHDRIMHLEMLRNLQDETGGFTAFITWPYQQGDMRLQSGNTSAAEYLRVQALARLFLDNIPHLQSSWVTQGPSIGQIALSFGADDFGAVMFEENVVSAAGTTFRMTSDFIESQIRRAGYEPWRRNVRYQPVA